MERAQFNLITPILDEVISLEGDPNFTFLAGLRVGFKLSEKVEIGAFADYSAGREQVNTTIGTIPSTPSDMDLSFLNTGINVILVLNP